MNENEIVTHKIKAKTKTEKGEDAFVTYGTTTGKTDTVAVDDFCYIGFSVKTKFFHYTIFTPKWHLVL